MRNLTLTSTAFVLVTSQVFGAPPAAPAAVSAKPPLVVTRATDTEVVRAKAHTFRPATLVDATSEDRKEGPSLFPVRVARPVPVKPHLNVAKFGESMHAARFPAEWEKLQAEAAAEKAAESTKAPVPAKAE